MAGSGCPVQQHEEALTMMLSARTCTIDVPHRDAALRAHPRVDSAAPTGFGPRRSNPDDPVRSDGFRDGTNVAETQREAAQLPGHVQDDPCMGAAAGVCTLVLTSVGITVRQPRLLRSSVGTKMQA